MQNIALQTARVMLHEVRINAEIEGMCNKALECKEVLTKLYSLNHWC
jgi:hypothetical protein